MVDPRSKFFNNIAELLSNTAGAANGVKKEIDVIVKSQVEKLLNDFEVVQRDEFDAMKEMLIKEREKNDELEEKINSLEKLIKKPKKITK
jgi:BMFP domain-containing protein YqiC|tara:strand:+ start:1537 stop:1806 length:270 start_codon:yes stop_codon:yes gene_type:complete